MAMEAFVTKEYMNRLIKFPFVPYSVKPLIQMVDNIARREELEYAKIHRRLIVVMKSVIAR